MPFVVLAATFEINFFIHTGVERIGRYIQVFYEERAGAIGWETTAMNYGARVPREWTRSVVLAIFFAATMLNFFSSLNTDQRIAAGSRLSFLAHLAFAYRIVAREEDCRYATRRLDLDRFRSLANER